MKLTRILMVFAVCTLLIAGLSCTSYGISGSISYQLTTITEGQGSVSPSEGSFPDGDSVTITALPASGWKFDHWGGQGSGTQNPITITMDSAKTVYAYFTSNSVSTPTPTPTSTKTPTPTSSGQSESSKAAAYAVTKDELKNSIADYSTRYSGAFPMPLGTVIVNGISRNIIDFNGLLAANGGLLSHVPAGTYSAAGANNDNCDGGANGCSTYAHYIWAMDNYGNVYSTCMGSDCGSNNASGYQGVWP